jgi:hypothetical protein
MASGADTMADTGTTEAPVAITRSPGQRVRAGLLLFVLFSFAAAFWFAVIHFVAAA